MSIEKADIEQALRQYQDPYLGTDLVSAGVLETIDVSAAAVDIKVVLGFPCEAYRPALEAVLRQHLQPLLGSVALSIQIESKIIAHAVQKSLSHMRAVKNVIAVASGKGGVGKSTTSVNLALALKAEGANVGLLDADIYGPSQPRMLGMSGKPESKDGKTFEPKTPYGIQAMSIGLMVDEETPMIWRGPMVTQALQQLLFETHWQDIDYMIIDLPPGTGDTQLTLSQNIPVSGVVIVTTPQDIALLDARKALRMFEKVEVPVLGVVENMSTHICSQCGHTEAIFGTGGGQKMSQDYDIDLLGALPLDMTIREQVDNGQPTVAVDPESDIAQAYRQIARKMTAKLSLRSKDYAAVFPKIVVEND